MVAEFEDVEPDALYDVLHDPEYRSVWDTHMLAAEDAGHINVNNDVGYYASEYYFINGLNYSETVTTWETIFILYVKETPLKS